MTYSPEPTLVSSSRAASVSARSRSAPSCLKSASALSRWCSATERAPVSRDQPADREVAQGGLISLAEQIEQRRALREVVIRVGRLAARGVQLAAQPQELAPGRGRDLRIEHVGGRREPLSGVGQPSGERQGFGGDQHGLQRVERRRAGPEDVVGPRDGFVERAPPEGEPRAQDADRPFVPVAGLAAVGAVRLDGARQELAGHFVPAAHQVNLRERVEHRAGRLVELDRAAHVERAVQRVLGARQVAEPHADLAERAERDGQAVAGAVRLVERDAPLGERERLLVAMLEHHHARLVAADRGQHVVRRGRARPCARRAAARSSLLRSGRAARTRCPTTNGPARGGGGRRRRAARTRPWRCARGRSRCRRPCGSTGRARSARGRWRGIRARLRPASARGRAWRSRATDRRGPRPAGRAAATASTAGSARSCRETYRADGPARTPPDRGRPAAATPRPATRARRARRRAPGCPTAASGRAAAPLRGRGLVRARRPLAPGAPGGWGRPRGEYMEERERGAGPFSRRAQFGL